MAAVPHTIPELDRKGLRDFGLTTGAIVAVLFGLFFPWLLDRQINFLSFPGNWPWILLLLLGGWGLIAPLTLRPVYRVWMKFGLLMSRITTPIIMGIVFYGMFMPTGVIMRLFGKDAMARRFDDKIDSYRVPSKKAPTKNLEKPF